MNKKLKLLGYVFNNFPVEGTDENLYEYSIMRYLLEEHNVLDGIKEVINIQNVDHCWGIGGDTVSISGWATGGDGFVVINDWQYDNN